MNQKDAYVSEEPTPEYLYTVTVNGRRLRKGMEATLAPPRGRKEKRRYEFRYAEDYRGQLLLTFYGPVRTASQRFRTVREADVLVVHVRSEAR